MPSLRTLIRWLRERIMQDVPVELAGCEFECHRRACAKGDWESCPLRLREAALTDADRRPD